MVSTLEKIHEKENKKTPNKDWFYGGCLILIVVFTIYRFWHDSDRVDTDPRVDEVYVRLDKIEKAINSRLALEATQKSQITFDNTSVLDLSARVQNLEAFGAGESVGLSNDDPVVLALWAKIDQNNTRIRKNIKDIEILRQTIRSMLYGTEMVEVK